MDVDPDRQVRAEPPEADSSPLACPALAQPLPPPARIQECKEGFKTTKAIVKAKEAGEAALGSGRWADAVAAFEAGEAADRVTPVWVREVRIKLARALGKAARHADALAVLAKLFSAPHTSPLPDDGCPECHQTAAEAHLALGDFESAVRSARRAHEIDQGNGEYRDLLQRCEAALKQARSRMGARRGCAPGSRNPPRRGALPSRSRR